MKRSSETPSPRKMLSETVERELEERIMKGLWPVGFKLPSEGKLCEEFGVSRTAVREALKDLRGRGIIQTQRGSGSYVADAGLDMVSKAMNAYSSLTVGEKSASDLVEFRGMIEGAALYRLAANQDNREAVIPQLETALGNMRNAESSELFCHHDTEFHVIVMKSCNNAFVDMIAEVLYEKYLHPHQGVAEGINAEMREATTEEHEAILNAIKSGQRAESIAALDAHLKAAETRGKVLGDKS